MVLPDVNVLMYAHREDTPDHGSYRKWLESLVGCPGWYGLSDLVRKAGARGNLIPDP
ncbi:MAG: hypothetical protein ACLFVZ_11470 [Actinomycetota bacterium]